MDDDYLVAPVLLIVFASWVSWWVIGFSNGETLGRNKGIIYCMENATKCKVEYQYLKLTEKSK